MNVKAVKMAANLALFVGGAEKRTCRIASIEKVRTFSAAHLKCAARGHPLNLNNIEVE